jgi:hypothetical protein
MKDEHVQLMQKALSPIAEGYQDVDMTSVDEVLKKKHD